MIDHAVYGPARLARLAIAATVFAIAVTLAFALPSGEALAAQAAAGAGKADAALTTAASSTKKSGWDKTKAGWVYYRKGEKVVGLKKIDGARYYFNEKGIMLSSDKKIGKATFYIASSGRVLGVKLGSKCYYDTLRPMTSGDAYDFETFIWARSIVDSITKSSDSDATKLRKAFDWVLGQSYSIHRDFSPYSANWTAVYARDHFSGNGGDCHSDGAAFAYLAAAIGYDADVCIDSMNSGYAPSHCWCMIGSAVYDPLFAESKDYWGYYGATSGTYETSPLKRYRVPEYSSSNNKTGAIPAALTAAASVGLQKSNGAMTYYENGKKVRNAWRTIDGARYYFKKNGKAVTGPAKIKGVYYVFSKKGVLQNSKKSGVRIVKVDGVKYRVNKAGKAKPGWEAGKKRYFAANGSMVVGAWKKIGGARYYFGANGKKATGATKVNGVNYVFDAKGVLQSSSKAGKRQVTVSGHVYQVDKKGRAVPGWNDAKDRYFGKSGVLLCGIHLVNGKLYAADANGVYLPEKTAALRAAAQEGQPAIDLFRLLGKPVDKLYSPSCDFDGDDGLWSYKHFAVMTMRPAGAAEIADADLAAGAAADEAGSATDAPVETIRTIQAL